LKKKQSTKEFAAKTTYLIHSEQYANWVFDPSHPTQGRRFINGRNQFIDLMTASGNEVIEIAPRKATWSELERAHSSQYLDEVLNQHRTSQWSGQRSDLADLAALFAGGTLLALEVLLRGIAKTAIHFPGAKHHAQYDHSSGFCVFADFALAADIATKDHGRRVAILDIDAHHGDGTENLTAANPQVLTFSIHEKGIFPGTGNEDNPENNIFNLALTVETGKGDLALESGIKKFLHLSQSFEPDLIFIACGADAHSEDPLSSLQYSVRGYEAAAEQIRNVYPNLPILMGGAGGYLPDTKTPEVWASFAKLISLTKGE
jgi:acetoin utilization protein AcuC